MPIQVPIVKQVHADPGQKLIFKPNTMPVSHVTANQTSGNHIQIINEHTVSCSKSSVSSVTMNNSNSQDSKIPAQDTESQSFNSSAEISSPTNLDVRAIIYFLGLILPYFFYSQFFVLIKI